MTVSSVNNAYAAQAYSLGFNTLNNKSNTTSTSTGALRAAGLAAASSGYAGGLGSMASMLSEVMSGMGLSSGDKVSFQDILNYRNSLKESFEQETKAGLRKLGVDENVNFQVVSDGNGGIKVVTDSEDKAKIERFFADNPDLVKKFNQIESLTNVEAARKTQNLDVKATRRRIEVESMTAWFAGTGQSVSSIMDFSGAQSALLSAGLNKTV